MPKSPFPSLPARVRLVVLDVDGVLTAGGVYLGATSGGERIEFKRFDIHDGVGIRLLQRAGIEVAILTGRTSEAVRLRAEELDIEECHQGAGAGKLPVLECMLERLGIGWDEVAYVGDDLPDIPLLRRVGLPVAVANAVPEVVQVAAWVTPERGGAGAVRSIAEALLKAQGTYTDIVEAHVLDLEHPPPPCP